MNIRDLEFYKKSKTLTTALMTKAATYSSKSQTWKTINKEIEEINKEIKEIVIKCWTDTERVCASNKKSSHFCAVYGDIEVTLLKEKEKILIIISIKNKRIISIVGKVTSKNSEYNLQEIHATKEEAIGLIQYIINNWDYKKIKKA